MGTHTTKQNDLSPPLRTTLTVNGVALDLTGCTVEFIMRATGAPQPKVQAAADIIGDPTEGVVEYVWAAGDTDSIGTFQAEWEVTLPSTKPLTIPKDGYDTVVIVEELG